MQTAILFLCSGNSCRSQMAEGFARARGGDRLQVYSAGTDPVGINPLAVKVMAEVGVDLSEHRSKSLDEVPLGEVDLVVTLCSKAAGCAIALHGHTRREDWNLPDPAQASGSEAEVLAAFRASRDEIRARVEQLLQRV